MKLSELILAEKIYIAGDGLEGRAADKFCAAHCPYVPREIVSPISESVEDEGGVWIVSPGIPRKFFDNIPKERITAGTEIFFDSLSDAERARVIGVSGTKGKSTTTKFCTEALNAAGRVAVAAGNYGVPLLEVFDDFELGKHEYVVAELSSYQLENLHTSPGIAIFLNLFPDHLDRHGSVEAYETAKHNLFLHQKKNEILILPDVSDISVEILSVIHKSTPLDPELFAKDSSFRAAHWCQNLGTVEKLFELLHLPHEAIEKTIQEFEGLPHRMQHFSHTHDREWWDDAICTNPEAAIASVQFFGKKLGALILGGQDRGMDCSPLATALITYAPEALVLVLESEAAKRFLEAIPNAILVQDFDEAVTHVLQSTSEGTDIVLCPAAPSYDSFKNFKEKGDAWQKAVTLMG